MLSLRRDGSPLLRVLPPGRLAHRARPARRRRGRLDPPGHQRGVPHRHGHRRGRELHRADRLVRRGPGHRGAHPAQAARGARLRPRPRYVSERFHVRGRRRRARAGDGRAGAATCRWTGRRPACCTATARTRRSTSRRSTSALPSLLDRGVVFAHAHVRGGGENGRRWWLAGSLQRKQNTFGDFVAAADGLDGMVDGRRIVARGLSAGRPADGRGVLAGTAALARRGRRGAVRRRRQHDARRDPPADGPGVGRVGRPAPCRGLRLDARVQPVRQRAGAGRPAAPARHRRGARPAGHVLGAGQVGRADAGVRVAGRPAAAADGARRRRARRAVGPLRPPARTRPRSTPGCWTRSGGRTAGRPASARSTRRRSRRPSRRRGRRRGRPRARRCR